MPDKTPLEVEIEEAERAIAHIDAEIRRLRSMRDFQRGRLSGLKDPAHKMPRAPQKPRANPEDGPKLRALSHIAGKEGATLSLVAMSDELLVPIDTLRTTLHRMKAKVTVSGDVVKVLPQ